MYDSQRETLQFIWNIFYLILFLISLIIRESEINLTLTKYKRNATKKMKAIRDNIILKREPNSVLYTDKRAKTKKPRKQNLYFFIIFITSFKHGR